ncbi:MAG: chitobiase/beta-hexosaminidase C-terminal domain-containing protein [Kofleriaceae bacterium]
MSRAYPGAARLIVVAVIAACGVPESQPSPEAGVPSAKRTAATTLIPALHTRGHVRLIVGVKTEFEPEGKLSLPARFAQRDGIAKAQRTVRDRFPSSVRFLKSFESVPYLVVNVDDEHGLDALVDDPEISTIEEDALNRPLLNTTTPLIQATNAWANGWTGSGYYVAVLDTGVMKTHTHLSGKVQYEACYSTTDATYTATSLCPGGVQSSTATDSGVNCSTAISGCDHGTHVAAIATSSNATHSGVAKGANLIAIQVFSQFTSTTYCGAITPCVLTFNSDYLEGLLRVQTLAQSGVAIAAANMSLGGGEYTSECDSSHASIKSVISNLSSLGIATVVATGNDGEPDTIGSPACISNTVSVAATTDSDGIAEFSNRASFVDLVAPGFDVTAAVTSSTIATGSKSGTSMATPHVSGAFAVMRSAKSDMTVTEGLTALKNTGTSVLDTEPEPDRTMKRININAAIATLSVSTPTFSVAAGKYTSAQSVSLSVGTSGATIRYTTDGTTPTSSSTVYSSAISIPLNTTRTIKAKAFKTGLVTSSEATATYEVTGTVATPTMTPVAGTYTTAQSVTLSTTTSGATIRYTTNGTTPTSSSTVYSAAISVPLNAVTTIKAKAFKTDWADSAEASAAYNITGTVAAPTMTPVAGTYTTAQSITLSTTTSGATIRYTTNGTTPTSSSTVYSSAISVPLNTLTTIKAKAFKTDWTESAETTASYNVTGTVAAPSFSVPQGTYTTAQSITLSTTTPGATIRYTTNGATPTSSSTVYSSAISVPLNTATTIKAKAFKTDWTDSAEAAATYNVTGTVATPSFTPDPGQYTSSQNVTLSTATPGATIRYTTNGSTVTASSPVYATPIIVPNDSSMTIKTKAFKTDWLDSAEASATYEITTTVAAPTFGVPAGTYTSAPHVVLSTATPGATIRYTTDGTSVTASSPIYATAIVPPLDATTTLKARAFKTGMTDSGEATAVYVVTGTVATPTFSVPAGTYTSAQSVALSTTTPGATIRYTVDGTTPTASSLAYTTPIPAPLDATLVIKAKAFKTEWATSAETSATYEITGSVAAPTFSIPADTYTTAQMVSLATTTPGATIRYTTDGSAPTGSSTLYASPISVPLNTTTTIRAIALKTSWATSSVASATYVVTGTVATPTFGIASGTYTTAQMVTLTTATAGATIRYTTDGAPPTALSPIYDSAIAVPLDTTMTITAKAFKDDWIDSGVASATYVVTGTVATPELDPPGGSFAAPQDVAISTATPGATIRYTTDGSTVTASSPIYSSPIAVADETTMTIKARAFKDDWSDSSEVAATYQISSTVATPTFSVPGGTYTTARTVTLSTTTAGATIRYTTDGTSVTASSDEYAGAITVPLDTTVTINAKAFKAGMSDSGEASATYVVTGTVATPTFSPAGGSYSTAQSVTLASATADATIRYTTDGSTVTTSSPIYSGAITVAGGSTTTIKAKAYKTDWVTSSQASATYTITSVDPVTFSPPGGTFGAAQAVVLSTTTSGATIRYTTNGSMVTPSSPAYSSPIVIPIDTMMTIKAVAFKPMYMPSAVASAVYTVVGTAEAPTFSVLAGTYTSAQSVELSTPTSGATIRYTINGSSPTSSSPIYTSAIAVGANTTMTIKAKAFRAGWFDSSEAEATYVVTGTVATPSFDVAAGTYTTAQNVVLSSATSGATIRYTTDGSAPTESSAIYTSAIAVDLDSTKTIKAKAFKADWLDSAEATATYVVTGTVAAPAFSPPGGSFDAAQLVTLSTTTPSAIIRYTTDGSPVTASSTAYGAAIPVAAEANITIRARAFRDDWATSNEASATFTVVCTTHAPQVVIDPASQSTGPGGLLNYTATITNRNDAGCMPVQFGLSWTVPGAGWTSHVDKAQVTLASGASTTVELTVASPASLVAGNYPLSVAAYSNRTGAGAGVATYTVTCTRNAPSFALSPGQQSGDAGVELSYTATITNNDVGCHPSTFTVASAGPAAWLTDVTTASQSIASGASATATVSVTSPLGTAVGDYGVSAELTRAETTGATANATYTIAPCVRNAPTLSLSPSSQTAVRGATLQYTASLTNYDESCGSTTFVTTLGLPSGWIGATDAITVASGTNVDFTIDVTAPADASAADYVVALEVSSAVHSAISDTTTFTVVPSCTRQNPLVSPIQPAGVDVPIALRYTVQVTNQDHIDCGGSTFALSSAVPGGWTATSPSQAIAAGASAMFDVDVTPPASLLASSTAFAITATNTAATNFTASAQVNYVLGCARAKPILTVAAVATDRYTVKLTNQDPSPCGSSSYRVALASSLALSPDHADILLASGAEGAFEVSVAANASPGDYPVAITVTRLPDNTVAETTSVTITIAADPDSDSDGDGDGDGGGKSGGCATGHGSDAGMLLLGMLWVLQRRGRRVALLRG